MSPTPDTPRASKSVLERRVGRGKDRELAPAVESVDESRANHGCDQVVELTDSRRSPRSRCRRWSSRARERPPGRRSVPARRPAEARRRAKRRTMHLSFLWTSRFDGRLYRLCRDFSPASSACQAFVQRVCCTNHVHNQAGRCPIRCHGPVAPGVGTALQGSSSPLGPRPVTGSTTKWLSRACQTMRRLVDEGWSASNAAAAVLEDRVPPAEGPTHADAAEAPAPTDHVERFVSAAERPDVAGIERVLDAMLAEGTFETVADRFLMPALVALGEAWASGRIGVAAEHAASHAVHRRLSAAFQAAAQRRGGRGSAGRAAAGGEARARGAGVRRRGAARRAPDPVPGARPAGGRLGCDGPQDRRDAQRSSGHPRPPTGGPPSTSRRRSAPTIRTSSSPSVVQPRRTRSWKRPTGMGHRRSISPRGSVPPSPP